MIKCFEIFTPIVRGNLDAIEELARRFVEGQAKQNVIYTEVRYSPHLLAEGGSFSGTEKVDPRPVIAAVTRGLRAGCEACGVTVNQILCCITWRGHGRSGRCRSGSAAAPRSHRSPTRWGAPQ